jgi:hypothetical protein
MWPTFFIHPTSEQRSALRSLRGECDAWEAALTEADGSIVVNLVRRGYTVAHVRITPDGLATTQTVGLRPQAPYTEPMDDPPDE